MRTFSHEQISLPISSHADPHILASVCLRRDGQECPESLLKNDLGDFAAFYEKAMGGMR